MSYHQPHRHPPSLTHSHTTLTTHRYCPQTSQDKFRDTYCLSDKENHNRMNHHTNYPYHAHQSKACPPAMQTATSTVTPTTSTGVTAAGVLENVAHFDSVWLNKETYTEWLSNLDFNRDAYNHLYFGFPSQHEHHRGSAAAPQTGGSDETCRVERGRCTYDEHFIAMLQRQMRESGFSVNSSGFPLYTITSADGDHPNVHKKHESFPPHQQKRDGHDQSSATSSKRREIVQLAGFRRQWRAALLQRQYEGDSEGDDVDTAPSPMVATHTTADCANMTTARTHAGGCDLQKHDDRHNSHHHNKHHQGQRKGVVSAGPQLQDNGDCGLERFRSISAGDGRPSSSWYEPRGGGRSSQAPLTTAAVKGGAVHIDGRLQTFGDGETTPIVVECERPPRLLPSAAVAAEHGADSAYSPVLNFTTVIPSSYYGGGDGKSDSRLDAIPAEFHYHHFNTIGTVRDTQKNDSHFRNNNGLPIPHVHAAPKDMLDDTGKSHQVTQNVNSAVLRNNCSVPDQSWLVGPGNSHNVPKMTAHNAPQTTSAAASAANGSTVINITSTTMLDISAGGPTVMPSRFAPSPSCSMHGSMFFHSANSPATTNHPTHANTASSAFLTNRYTVDGAPSDFRGDGSVLGAGVGVSLSSPDEDDDCATSAEHRKYAAANNGSKNDIQRLVSQRNDADQQQRIQQQHTEPYHQVSRVTATRALTFGGGVGGGEFYGDTVGTMPFDSDTAVTTTTGGTRTQVSQTHINVSSTFPPSNNNMQHNMSVANMSSHATYTNSSNKMSTFNPYTTLSQFTSSTKNPLLVVEEGSGAVRCQLQQQIDSTTVSAAESTHNKAGTALAPAFNVQDVIERQFQSAAVGTVTKMSTLLNTSTGQPLATATGDCVYEASAPTLAVGRSVTLGVLRYTAFAMHGDVAIARVARCARLTRQKSASAPQKHSERKHDSTQPQQQQDTVDEGEEEETDEPQHGLALMYPWREGVCEAVRAAVAVPTVGLLSYVSVTGYAYADGTGLTVIHSATATSLTPLSQILSSLSSSSLAPSMLPSPDGGSAANASGVGSDVGEVIVGLYLRMLRNMIGSRLIHSCFTPENIFIGVDYKGSLCAVPVHWEQLVDFRMFTFPSSSKLFPIDLPFLQSASSSKTTQLPTQYGHGASHAQQPTLRQPMCDVDIFLSLFLPEHRTSSDPLITMQRQPLLGAGGYKDVASNTRFLTGPGLEKVRRLADALSAAPSWLTISIRINDAQRYFPESRNDALTKVLQALN